jgi:hypothetical protein
MRGRGLGCNCRERLSLSASNLVSMAHSNSSVEIEMRVESREIGKHCRNLISRITITTARYYISHCDLYNSIQSNLSYGRT